MLLATTVCALLIFTVGAQRAFETTQTCPNAANLTSRSFFVNPLEPSSEWSVLGALPDDAVVPFCTNSSALLPFEPMHVASFGDCLSAAEGAALALPLANGTNSTTAMNGTASSPSATALSTAIVIYNVSDGLCAFLRPPIARACDPNRDTVFHTVSNRTQFQIVAVRNADSIRLPFLACGAWCGVNAAPVPSPARSVGCRCVCDAGFTGQRCAVADTGAAVSQEVPLIAYTETRPVSPSCAAFLGHHRAAATTVPALLRGAQAPALLPIGTASTGTGGADAATLLLGRGSSVSQRGMPGGALPVADGETADSTPRRQQSTIDGYSFGNGTGAEGVTLAGIGDTPLDPEGLTEFTISAWLRVAATEGTTPSPLAVVVAIGQHWLSRTGADPSRAPLLEETLRTVRDDPSESTTTEIFGTPGIADHPLSIALVADVGKRRLTLVLGSATSVGQLHVLRWGNLDDVFDGKWHFVAVRVSMEREAQSARLFTDGSTDWTDIDGSRQCVSGVTRAEEIRLAAPSCAAGSLVRVASPFTDVVYLDGALTLGYIPRASSADLQLDLYRVAFHRRALTHKEIAGLGTDAMADAAATDINHAVIIGAAGIFAAVLVAISCVLLVVQWTKKHADDRNTMADMSLAQSKLEVIIPCFLGVAQGTTLLLGSISFPALFRVPFGFAFFAFSIDVDRVAGQAGVLLPAIAVFAAALLFVAVIAAVARRDNAAFKASVLGSRDGFGAAAEAGGDDDEVNGAAAGAAGGVESALPAPCVYPTPSHAFAILPEASFGKVEGDFSASQRLTDDACRMVMAWFAALASESGMPDRALDGLNMPDSFRLPLELASGTTSTGNRYDKASPCDGRKHVTVVAGALRRAPAAQPKGAPAAEHRDEAEAAPPPRTAFDTVIVVLDYVEGVATGPIDAAAVRRGGLQVLLRTRQCPVHHSHVIPWSAARHGVVPLREDGSDRYQCVFRADNVFGRVIDAPCAQKLMTCPHDECGFTVCSRCFVCDEKPLATNLGPWSLALLFVLQKRYALVHSSAAKLLGSVALVLSDALYLPAVTSAVVILSCHPSITCVFPECLSTDLRGIPLVAVVLAACTLVLVGIGLFALQLYMVMNRKLAVVNSGLWAAHLRPPGSSTAAMRPSPSSDAAMADGTAARSPRVLVSVAPAGDSSNVDEPAHLSNPLASPRSQDGERDDGEECSKAPDSPRDNNDTENTTSDHDEASAPYVPASLYGKLFCVLPSEQWDDILRHDRSMLRNLYALHDFDAMCLLPLSLLFKSALVLAVIIPEPSSATLLAAVLAVTAVQGLVTVAVNQLFDPWLNVLQRGVVGHQLFQVGLVAFNQAVVGTPREAEEELGVAPAMIAVTVLFLVALIGITVNTVVLPYLRYRAAKKTETEQLFAERKAQRDLAAAEQRRRESQAALISTLQNGRAFDDDPAASQIAIWEGLLAWRSSELKVERAQARPLDEFMASAAVLSVCRRALVSADGDDHTGTEELSATLRTVASSGDMGRSRRGSVRGRGDCPGDACRAWLAQQPEDAIAACVTLTELRFHSSVQSGQFQALAKMLRACRTVHTLDLSRQKTASLAELFDLVPTVPSLATLVLRSVRTSPAASVELSTAFETMINKSPQLTALDMSENVLWGATRLQGKSVKGFFDCLKAGQEKAKSPLKHLLVERMPAPSAGYSFKAVLLPFVQRDTTLSSLSLAGCVHESVGQAVVTTVASQAAPRLEALDLSATAIRDSASLVTLIKKCKRLTTLKCGRNPLEDATQLVKAARALPRLRELDVSQCLATVLDCASEVISREPDAPERSPDAESAAASEAPPDLHITYDDRPTQSIMAFATPEGVISVPANERVTVPAVGGSTSSADAEAWPLRELRLGGRNRITVTELGALIDSGLLRQTSTIRIARNPLGAGLASAVSSGLSNSRLGSLAQLDVSRCDIPASALRQLLRELPWHQLRSLGIAGNGVNDAVLRLLATVIGGGSSSHAGGEGHTSLVVDARACALESLDMGHVAVVDDGVDLLPSRKAGTKRSLAKIAKVAVAVHRLKDASEHHQEGAKAGVSRKLSSLATFSGAFLEAVAHAPALRVLRLPATGLSADVGPTLWASTSAIRELDLRSNPKLSVTDLTSLLTSTCGKTVELLDVGGCSLFSAAVFEDANAEGASALHRFVAGLGACKGLRALGLSNNGITKLDAFTPALADHPALEVLDAALNPIVDGSVLVRWLSRGRSRLRAVSLALHTTPGRADDSGEIVADLVRVSRRLEYAQLQADAAESTARVSQFSLSRAEVERSGLRIIAFDLGEKSRRKRNEQMLCALVAYGTRLERIAIADRLDVQHASWHAAAEQNANVKSITIHDRVPLEPGVDRLCQQLTSADALRPSATALHPFAKVERRNTRLQLFTKYAAACVSGASDEVVSQLLDLLVPRADVSVCVDGTADVTSTEESDMSASTTLGRRGSMVAVDRLEGSARRSSTTTGPPPKPRGRSSSVTSNPEATKGTNVIGRSGSKSRLSLVAAPAALTPEQAERTDDGTRAPSEALGQMLRAIETADAVEASESESAAAVPDEPSSGADMSASTLRSAQLRVPAAVLLGAIAHARVAEDDGAQWKAQLAAWGLSEEAIDEASLHRNDVPSL